MRSSLKGCIVTTYEIIIKDVENFMNLDLKYLVVDEGHRLKNVNCKLISILKNLQTNGNRLLMTGTPLQNNMSELWTLLNFILPDIFTDFETFNKWFDYDSQSSGGGGGKDKDSAINEATSWKLNKIINDELQKNLISNLHVILRPFLLRRLKKNVLKGVIPPKREYLINCHLTDKQLEYYKHILNSQIVPYLYTDGIFEFFHKNRSKYGLFRISNAVLLEYLVYKKTTQDNSSYDDKTEYMNLFRKIDQFVYNRYILKQIKFKKTGNTIMQLRQIVDSSLLMFNPYYHYKTIDNIDLQSILESSGKLQKLDQILSKIITPGNHRILIFSQFFNMLDILEDYLNLKKLNFYRIDGGIKNEDRFDQINDFQDDSNNKSGINVFLLSTRAGGLGINLTKADTVILFDSDWNPQVDIQAIDRIHRIGQTQPVLIYRFICDKTIENLQLLKIIDKKNLEKIIIEFGNFQIFKSTSSPQSATNNTSSGNKSVVPIGNNLLKLELNNLLLQRKSIMGFNETFSKTSDSGDENALTKEELNELKDRSLKAYSDSSAKKFFKNIKLFETSNNSLT